MNNINYQNNNEIDLIELIKALWNKRFRFYYRLFLVPLLRRAMSLQLKSNGLLLQLLWLHVQLI